MRFKGDSLCCIICRYKLLPSVTFGLLFEEIGRKALQKSDAFGLVDSPGIGPTALSIFLAPAGEDAVSGRVLQVFDLFLKF